jgi:hypothetical protein
MTLGLLIWLLLWLATFFVFVSLAFCLAYIGEKREKKYYRRKFLETRKENIQPLKEIINKS